MKLKVYKYKKIKSTNDVALRKIKLGINQGVIITEKQTKGRGRHGNKWISMKGNLLMSIFFKIKKNITLNNLTFKNCQLVKKSIQNLTKYKIQIKKPNDLLINKSKICGILQEISFFNEKKFLIVGIGLNLEKSPYIKNYQTNHLKSYTNNKINKLSIFKKIKKLYEKEIKYLK
tara:strand:- start:929 stop:1450 length:522 start_codon:yes stop_codon:yes gene_type:complete